LFPRAAERAGLVAKEQSAPLKKVSDLVLPAVLLTGENEACVLLSVDHEKGQAEIVGRDTGFVATTVTLKDLEEDYS
ncbi:type I secretion system permease/ATPase, partial [Vibrio sp. 10N.261.45.A4]